VHAAKSHTIDTFFDRFEKTWSRDKNGVAGPADLQDYDQQTKEHKAMLRALCDISIDFKIRFVVEKDIPYNLLTRNP
jgi:hypothetical protein